MASLPTTMKGVLIQRPGGVEVLQYKTDLPVPVPQYGEVLIKNEFSGVNYIDTYFRSGLAPLPSPILGREAEGTIVSTASSGDLYNFKAGDRVVFLHTGGYAEYTSVPASKVHLIPSGFPPGHAAASLLQGLTAMTFIWEAAKVKNNNWVLVHAAAGGTGSLLCQLLREVGARVIGTASTEEKLREAKENGATYVLNYKTEKDLVGKIREITGGEGIDVIFDSTGKDQFENSVDVLKERGTLLAFGISSGHLPPSAGSRVAAKKINMFRPALMNYVSTRKEFEKYTTVLFDLVAKEKLKIKIHKTYPLADIQQAHSDLEGRKTTGKLLLKP